MAPLELGLKGSPAVVGTSEKSIAFFLLSAGMSSDHQGSMYPGAPALLGRGAANSESHQKSIHQFTLTLVSSSLN